MNVFATSSCPVESALALDDLRLNKMITESVQILCTAKHLCGRGESWMMRPTHVNHPCVRWACDEANYSWLHAHAVKMSTLYAAVADRVHKSAQMLPALSIGAKSGAPSAFMNCARNLSLGLDFTGLPIHEAYRRYLAARWAAAARPPRWTYGSKPRWLDQMIG